MYSEKKNQINHTRSSFVQNNNIIDLFTRHRVNSEFNRAVWTHATHLPGRRFRCCCGCPVRFGSTNLIPTKDHRAIFTEESSRAIIIRQTRKYTKFGTYKCVCVRIEKLSREFFRFFFCGFDFDLETLFLNVYTAARTFATCPSPRFMHNLYNRGDYRDNYNKQRLKKPSRTTSN